MANPTLTGPRWSTIVFLVFLLSACAQTAKEIPAAFTDTAIPTGYTFPHPATVAEPTVHGAWVIQSGSTLCMDCHKTDANTTLPGPKCTSCHANYPHTDEWVDKVNHGKYVIDNGTAGCQTTCHGTDLAGGNSTIACTKCHETYPHVAEWQSSATNLHGTSARTDKNVCKLCHGDTFSGGQSAVKCSDCHAPYPHADKWVASTGATSVHGPIVSVEGSTQCEGCHGANNSGSIFSAYCVDCHIKHESSPTTCTSCHEAGKGLAADAMRPSDGIHPATTDCASCHDYSTGDFKVLRGETTDFTQSAHASTTGAFMKESDSTSCMRCHTATGFKDYIKDGSMDAAILGADVPDPLTCTACHNADTATYSSGVTLDISGFTPGDNPANYKRTADGGTGQHLQLSVGREGLCLKCHAPRSSDGAIKVNAWVYGMGVDTVYDTNSSFTYAQYPANNTATPAGKVSSSTKRSGAVTFHYVPVLATFYGNDAKEGFQYATNPDGAALTYVGKNNLMVGFETCIDCHNPHTTEVQPAKCTSCHAGVTTTADFQNIRVATSDYDGDGNISEGTYAEVEGVKAKLYTAIQNYAKGRAGLPGEIEMASVAKTTAVDGYAQSKGSWYVKGTGTAYSKWTPRMVKAVYNYHLSFRDPGAYVHNSKYMIQLMYDSIKDLNSASGMTPVDMTGMVRP